MRVLVLGSAAGGGFPQWNCGCVNCVRAREGDPAALPRTQASLAVSADGRAWAVLNAAPDLKQQIDANPKLHAASGANGRHSPIAAVVVTGGDIDQIAGLLVLRESQPFAVYAAAPVLGTLASNSLFNVLNADFVARREIALGAPSDLADAKGKGLGLRVTAFTVPGKIALYLEDAAAGANFGTREGDVVGLEVAEPATGARFFFIPGCAALTPALAERIKGAPLVFFDGTLWQDDEMIRAGLGTKTGQRMGHMSLSGPSGSIAALAPLGIGRKVYIHINNTNPVLLADSAERREAQAAGWEIGEDGMEIEL